MQPWEPEHEMSDAQVEGIVRANTDLAVTSVEYLGEGWDFYNYLVDQDWVFRFPKRKSEADTLAHEKRVLESLELCVPTPIFDYWIERPTDFHLPFAGYRFIPGQALGDFARDELDWPVLGRQLGAMLRDLHSHDLEGVGSRRDPLYSWLTAKDPLKDELEIASKHLDQTTIAVIRQCLATYRLRRTTAELVSTHNDLGVEHILLNDDGRLVGLIDWADANQANRYVDFAGLWAWGGDAFLREVLGSYVETPTPIDLALIRAFGICYALAQIEDAELRPNSCHNQEAQRWLANRIAEGSLANLYAPLPS